jgi:aspartate racemase
MMNKPKKLGIIGGMGPSASCNWYRTILSILEKKYGFTQDEQYPEMYIHSLSMEGWSEKGIEDQESVKKSLLSAIRNMEYLKVDYLVIACNTAHIIYDYLQSNTSITILNLIDECVVFVKSAGYDIVGMISTETTNRNEIYSKRLERIGIKCISLGMPFEQGLINKVILSVQSGKCGKEEKEVMKFFIQYLKDKGAKAIVLGCTELPLSIAQKDVDISLIDPGYVLLNKVTDLLYEDVFSVVIGGYG